MANAYQQRCEMVEKWIASRGVESPLVLDAMRAVPREAFVPDELREFAYDDSPLPIADGQTISQPFIVAMMIEALGLEGGERVLEIGAGSGYAAAVLAQIAGKVFTVERLEPLATRAAQTLQRLGYDNVEVIRGDGTKGWPEHAPYDAIVVAAGAPAVPESLKAQLKIGGRLVIPIGMDQRAQELVRVTRTSGDTFQIEDMADVRFVPLIGQEGWSMAPDTLREAPPARPTTAVNVPSVRTITHFADPFESVETADLSRLLQRIGDARIVLIGEATHGTSEFYRIRARITRELIEQEGFAFVAIEGDWPDAAKIDHYVRHFEYPPSEWTAFARFPTWMWRNSETREFVDWLRSRNGELDSVRRTALYGLDIYSMYRSIQSVLSYLEDVDPVAASIARERYGCLTPWQSDPTTYGRAALTGGYRTCEDEVARMLTDILRKQSVYASRDGERFIDALQNARLVAAAERYYRIMYYGSRASWNLRDGHMFETLQTLLAFHGPESRAIVWAHNSHVGNAAATEMFGRGEYNIGYLCRQEFGEGCHIIGMGTHGGTVAAASSWEAPVEIKTVRPSHPESYERLCHEADHANFLLSLREPEVLKRLSQPRLERAIGVIYRPETELASHYFQAILPRQFDEYVWLDHTRAVSPLEVEVMQGLPDTYPFGL